MSHPWGVILQSMKYHPQMITQPEFEQNRFIGTRETDIFSETGDFNRQKSRNRIF